MIDRTDHDAIQDLLEGYVDETLDRSTRHRVDEHLAGCAECRAILDEVAPVNLDALGPGAWDERAARRAIRRSIRRTVVDAALVILAVWIAGWLVLVLVVQPFIIGRGDRPVAAGRATIDAAVMLTPGAALGELSVVSSGLSRIYQAEMRLPIGSGSNRIGEVETRLGLFGVQVSSGADDWERGGSARSTLLGLGSGTVATVSVYWEDPLTIGEAQQLADSTSHDTRVVWVGFHDGTPLGDSLFGRVLGYPTCGTRPDLDDDFFRATSAGGGGGGIGFAPVPIGSALDDVRRGVRNLADNPQVAAALFHRGETLEGEMAAVVEHLESPEPGVAVLVFTGPTPQLLGLLDDLEVDGEMLGVDLYNWSTPFCGR